MPDSKFVKSALARYNYLPSQKEKAEELPPIFTTSELTDDLIQQIADLPFTRGRDCYDLMEYRATRFNNVSRPIAIPHPKPYLNLVDKLSNHWDEFESIASNPKSVVRPREHKDGRLIIMDYESSYEKTRNLLSKSFGTKYVVHTDIKNFYPSIYSHSIPWALVGFDYAKDNRDQELWFNQIDQKVRSIKRGETNGVPIGPATSNIIAEIILEKIDKKLSEKYPHHIRYIDDYTSFHETRESAENFIIDLEQYLSEYKLVLSLKKTSILEQPISLSPQWISDLTTRLPKGDKINYASAIRFLDYANQIREIYPDGSILKYAVKSIIGRLKRNAEPAVLDYIFNTSMKYPVLIPLMESIFKERPLLMNQTRKNKVKMLLKEHAKYNRHDIVCWLLYYAIKYRIRINKEIREDILYMSDCLSIYLLLQKYPSNKELIKYIKTITSSDDIYKWDNYWMLIYEAFRMGLISNPYSDEVFEILKGRDLKFHIDI